MRTDNVAARKLVGDLLRADFDVVYSYLELEGAKFPHAIVNTQLFLEDHYGTQFPYKLLPITVSCYGQHVIAVAAGCPGSPTSDARTSTRSTRPRRAVSPSVRRCAR